MLDREELERLARRRLTDIPIQPEDWPILVPQIERVLSIVAELGHFPMEDAEPAPTYSPAGSQPASSGMAERPRPDSGVRGR